MRTLLRNMVLQISRLIGKIELFHLSLDGRQYSFKIKDLMKNRKIQNQDQFVGLTKEKLGRQKSSHDQKPEKEPFFLSFIILTIVSTLLRGVKDGQKSKNLFCSTQWGQNIFLNSHLKFEFLIILQFSRDTHLQSRFYHF